VATGHYLKIKKSGKQFKLYKAKDKNKDQSYFLYTFNQDQLKHLLFPLGNYTKPQVRALAKKFKLPVAEKAESQEICFIPGKHHNDFLKKYLQMKPGDIKLIDEDNKIIGRHQGLPLYTIGQRRGINIGGTGPYYAAKFDWKKNDLYVVNKFDDALLYGRELTAKNVSWLAGKTPKMPLKCAAVIRYRHPAVPCTVVANNGLKTDFVVRFNKPQRAITPGQSVVFYKGTEVLGGGIIK
jgi:tRNA-specific 2-thiouridylase